MFVTTKYCADWVINTVFKVLKHLFSEKCSWTLAVPEYQFPEKNITELESQISSNSSDHLINEYNQCKYELEKLYDYITAGIILWSRTTWYKQGEKSSKYFINLEKHNRGKSHTRKLTLRILRVWNYIGYPVIS